MLRTRTEGGWRDKSHKAILIEVEIGQRPKSYSDWKFPAEARRQECPLGVEQQRGRQLHKLELGIWQRDE